MTGEILPGKEADFVVLDHNPLEADPMELREIEVLATIKHDIAIYTKNSKG